MIYREDTYDTNTRIPRGSFNDNGAVFKIVPVSVNGSKIYKKNILVPFY